MRRWRGWPKNFVNRLNGASGVIGLGGAGLAVAGAVVATPVIIGVGGVFVAGTILYAGTSTIPEKVLEAKNCLGTRMDLSRLELIHPTPPRIGLVGPSKSGKSTFLHQAVQDTTPPRTENVTFLIKNDQSKPGNYIAIIDGAGQSLAQQKRIVRCSELILIFFDHDPGANKVAPTKSRTEENKAFLYNVIDEIINYRNEFEVKKAILVFNKQDLWERSANKKRYYDWSNEMLEAWRKSEVFIPVEPFYHSNVVSNRINELINTIFEEVSV